MKFISGVWFAFALGSLSFLVFIVKQDMVWQAWSCAVLWLMALRLMPNFTSLMVLLLSPLPFLFSAKHWVKSGFEADLLYGFAQMSPLYQWFRPFADPWKGGWVYLDSPFHYAIESGATTLACIPMFFMLICMLVTAFRHAES